MDESSSARRRCLILAAVLLSVQAAKGSEEGGGRFLVGMHPAGQPWVEEHGDYAETSLDQCRPCHGADLHGSALSRTTGDRDLLADDFGRKLFWAGFQVGCWACHDGPGSERAARNRAAGVEDASLAVVSGASGRVRLAITDADGDMVDVRIVTAPAYGVARIDGLDVVYTAALDFSGEDALTVAAWDGRVDSNLGTVFVSVRGEAGAACVGDCDGDGQVAVSELVRAVRRALGLGAAAECAAADGDGDTSVSVDELVSAVRDALEGCGGGAATPTPTSTRAPSPPATASATGGATGTETPTLAAVPATPTRVTPSFAVLQAEIFAPTCAVSFCHDAQYRAGGLSLAAGMSYAELVGVAASNAAAKRAGLKRVEPGSPDTSFLLIKLSGPAASQGLAMPPTGPLPAAQQALVRAWIAAGAVP